MLPRAECAARVRRAPGTIARRVDGQCIPAHISPVNEGVAFAAEDGTGPGYRSAPDRQGQPPRRIGRNNQQDGESSVGSTERPAAVDPIRREAEPAVWGRTKEVAAEAPSLEIRRTSSTAARMRKTAHRAAASVWSPRLSTRASIWSCTASGVTAFTSRSSAQRHTRRRSSGESFSRSSSMVRTRVPRVALLQRHKNRFKVPGRSRPDSLHPQ